MRISAALACAVLVVPLAAADFVWVEGEKPSRGQGHPHPWYSEAVQKGALSGGAFLSSFTDKADSEVDYDLTVPADGAYTLWARVNPIQAAVSWRQGDGPWQPVDLSRPIDSLNIASDAKPDLRFLAWVKVGRLALKAGPASLGFKLHSANHHHGALDCFVLVSGPFLPSGTNRPGGAATGPGEAEPGWFAFAPGQDGFGSDALLDLRALNEPRAGAKGWLKASGDDIVTPDGKPLRLWAVNASTHEGEDSAAYLFARLAKTGVNMARFHGLIAERGGDDPLALSKEALDALHYNLRAAAEQGIYVHLSTYFPLWLQLKESDGIAGAALGKHPFGLLLFEPRFQAMYKAWAKGVLTSKNPYTGRIVAEDPAVAVWEIQNEDSLLFWTMKRDNLGSGPWRTLGGLFAEWAIARHGSLDKALASWGGERHGEDDVAGRRLGLYEPWDTTRDGLRQARAGKQARVRDQVRFYAEQSRTAYADLAAYLRTECGFKGLITASNWTTADNRQLAGIERWSYAAATDLVDRHGYVGGKHEGDASAWSVRTGHTFEDKAAVLDPAGTPLGYLQLAGRPHLHSEIAWNKPNRFNADSQLLIASYAALQGIDGFFLFALGKGSWAGDGNGKWPAAMPSTMGQWPAAALQFRRGDLATALALRQVVRPDGMFAITGSGVVEGENADFRIGEAPKAADAGNDAGFDPLSYYAGRVERVIAGLPGAPARAEPLAVDLGKAIDRPGKVVTSLTGELRWDWGRGLVTVNALRSQAVTGFLAKGGAFALRDVTIASASEYGTVHVISLDGAPLATSRRILVQSFTEERMYGWRASNGRIEDTGRAPINVREIDASVTFAAPITAATALDGHGYAAGAVPVQGRKVVLPKDKLYVIVTR